MSLFIWLLSGHGMGDGLKFKVVTINLNLMLLANDKLSVYSLVLCIDFQYEPTNLQFVLG